MTDKMQLDPRYLYQVASLRLDQVRDQDDGLTEPLGQVVAGLRTLIDVGETMIEVTRDGWETLAREVTAQAEWSERHASKAWGVVVPPRDSVDGPPTES